MINLPSLISYTTSRPNRPTFEEKYRIPDSKQTEFWDKVYTFLFAANFSSPVKRNIASYINPLFGYFGFRAHPVTLASRYFHVGVSLDLQHGRKIYPARKGVLQYAGYGAINGYYVLLSHPDIVTEDGYVFHTMYCHLKKTHVGFNSYQKMLRKISLNSYPIIPVDTKKILGTASTSGVSRENHPGLYLQCSFRKDGETPIVIDPYRLYYTNVKINETADMIDQDHIKELFEKIKKKAL